MNSPIIVSRATPSHIVLIKAFYATVGYTGLVNDTDTIFIACTTKHTIVGAVRLVEEENVLVLRGMHVAYAYQKQGIGSALLRSLEKAITGHCFCLAHEWLTQFYGTIGFVKIKPQEAPLFLQERLKRYKKKYPYLIVMWRA